MSLAPKPPPTSGAITRTWWGARSRSSPTNWRIWCGTWEDAHTVSCSSVGFQSATSPRVSIGWGPRGGAAPRGGGPAPAHVVGDVVVARGRARLERLGGRERLVLDLQQLA